MRQRAGVAVKIFASNARETFVKLERNQFFQPFFPSVRVATSLPGVIIKAAAAYAFAP